MPERVVNVVLKRSAKVKEKKNTPREAGTSGQKKEKYIPLLLFCSLHIFSSRGKETLLQTYSAVSVLVHIPGLSKLRGPLVLLTATCNGLARALASMSYSSVFPLVRRRRTSRRPWTTTLPASIWGLEVSLPLVSFSHRQLQ